MIAHQEYLNAEKFLNGWRNVRNVGGAGWESGDRQALGMALGRAGYLRLAVKADQAAGKARVPAARSVVSRTRMTTSVRWRGAGAYSTASMITSVAGISPECRRSSQVIPAAMPRN